MKNLMFSVLIIAVSTPIIADDFDDMFSEDAFGDVEVEEVASSSSAFSLNHELGSKVVVNYNSDEANSVEETYSGLTGLSFYYRPSFSYQPNDDVSIKGEFEIASDSVFWLREDADWNDEDIEARQYQLGVNELVGQVRLNQWQLNTGIQTITLGLADALSVSNILYAQNLATPGVNDSAVSSTPAWTTTVNGSIGGVRVKAGSVHTHELNTLPITGSDFDTGTEAMLDMAGLTMEAEELALDNMAWFASMSGVVGALDWQFNTISQLSHAPTIELTMVSAGPPPVMVPSALLYPRVNTASAAFSYVAGSFLIKAEAAFADGHQAQDNLLAMQDYQRVSGVVGFDYNSTTIGRVIAEIQYGMILDYDALDLAQEAETSVQWAAIYSKTVLREQLEISAQLMGFGFDSNGGRLQGVGFEYSATDALMLGARVVDYVDGDFQFLDGADDRDRLILSVSYQF